MKVEDAIDQLADAGILSERQAEAYVLRDVEAVPRQEAAEEMGISVNTLDKRLGEARGHVEAAKQTVEADQQIRHEPVPEECSKCGDRLGNRWSQDDNGLPICLECAGITPEDAGAQTGE